jgi:hypothetical protein
MTAGSTMTLTPRPDIGLGVGAITERQRSSRGKPGPIDTLDALGTAIQRGSRPGYDAWLRHVAPAAGCTNPVLLRGQITTLDSRTNKAIRATSTDRMPDGVIYKACGNRRSSVCPSCAEVYRADAYQLVLAGLRGGKDVPDSVSGHPAVFLTATAPGFGLVHTRRTAKSGRVLACRPRRIKERCPHGVLLRCQARHAEDDPHLGQPLCLRCYDYRHHVVWNSQAGELWRRTIGIKADRLLAKHAKQHGDQGRVRLSYGKVGEYQRRGVVHFHALVRLDGIDPDHRDRVIPPPAWATVFVLAHLLRDAVAATVFYTEPHPANPHGWRINWGEQLDVRPLRIRGDQPITDTQVAGYLAKYATKGTDAAGHTSKRISRGTIQIHTDDGATHPGMMIRTAWQLGQVDGFDGLRRWAHMLGFGGHFFSKSKRYSTTFKKLRNARTEYRRRLGRAERVDVQLAVAHDEDTTLVINTLAYVGIGWHTTGDAMLANTSAAMARERRRAEREAERELEEILEYVS